MLLPARRGGGKPKPLGIDYQHAVDDEQNIFIQKKFVPVTGGTHPIGWRAVKFSIAVAPARGPVERAGSMLAMPQRHRPVVIQALGQWF